MPSDPAPRRRRVRWVKLTADGGALLIHRTGQNLHLATSGPDTTDEDDEELPWVEIAPEEQPDLRELLDEAIQVAHSGSEQPSEQPSAPLLTTDQWAAIRHVVSWLDARNGHGHHETALRIMKITEETGEAASAYIGMVGQNPRKGRTHHPDQVAGELCDVILGAAVALVTIAGGDAEQALDDRITAVHRRTANPKEEK